MSFKTMTIEYHLRNSGKNEITYHDGTTEPIPVPVGHEHIFTITLNDTCSFTLTEANHPEEPLTVTLVQQTDDRAEVLPQGSAWTVNDEGEQLTCMIQLDSGIQDQLTLDAETQREGDSIVIVGTVEIYDHTLARKKSAPVNQQ